MQLINCHYIYRMKTPLKRLFVLSVIAAIGLLLLQANWIRQGLRDANDILERQVDYAFQKAIDRELEARQDSLFGQLKTMILDTVKVGIDIQQDSIKHTTNVLIFEAGAPAKNRVSIGNAGITASSPAEQKAQAYQFILDNLKKQISESTIFFYTQSLGFTWQRLSSNLSIDSSKLSMLFREELGRKNISAPFAICFYKMPGDNRSVTGSLHTSAKPVNYSGLKSFSNPYMAVAIIASPIKIVLKKLWLNLIASALLILLTLYCLFRMYRTILQQKQLSDIKNDFIGNMTHELKTPIATITAAIDALQYFNAMSDANRKQRYLDTSRKELERLDGIVTKVMELSLYETASIRLDKEPVEVKSLFTSVVDHLRIVHQCTITPGEDLTINIDQTHLTNVFYNLVENAVKYVEDLHLVFTAKKEGGLVILALQDNGPGIKADYLPFIFDKFYRVPQGNLHTAKGFGLGLYYVKKIIEAHGGQIHVQSNTRTGTIFTIQLPIQ